MILILMMTMLMIALDFLEKPICGTTP